MRSWTFTFLVCTYCLICDDNGFFLSSLSCFVISVWRAMIGIMWYHSPNWFQINGVFCSWMQNVVVSTLFFLYHLRAPLVSSLIPSSWCSHLLACLCLQKPSAQAYLAFISYFSAWAEIRSLEFFNVWVQNHNTDS